MVLFCAGSRVSAGRFCGLQGSSEWLLYSSAPLVPSFSHRGSKLTGEHFKDGLFVSGLIMPTELCGSAQAATSPLCRELPMVSCTWTTAIPSTTVTKRPSVCAGSACCRAVCSAGEPQLTPPPYKEPWVLWDSPVKSSYCNYLWLWMLQCWQ